MKCEVCRDLLPLYIDGLTSEVTNEEIELHMDECDACREIYEDMSSAVVDELKEEFQIPRKEEIDYLKKFRRKIKQYILSGGLFLTIVIAIMVLFSIPMTVSSENVELITYEKNGDFHIEGRWKGSRWSRPNGLTSWSLKSYETEEETGYEDVYKVSRTLINGAVFEDWLHNRNNADFIFHLSYPIEDGKEPYRVRITFSDKDVIYERGNSWNSEKSA